MTRHVKLHAAPKSWPIRRKGKTFVVKGNSKSIPLLVVLRDLLKLAQTRKEVKSAVHMKHLLISNKPVVDEKKPLELFDTLSILPAKKYYRVSLSDKGKFEMEEISEKESKFKVSKIVGKKTLKSKKNQVNLFDGRNYLSEVEYKVNDSVLVDLEKNSISKILPLKTGANVLVIAGKHIGEKGKVASILTEEKMVEVESKENKYKVLIKQLMVTD